jgi:hypothetical protein
MVHIAALLCLAIPAPDADYFGANLWRGTLTGQWRLAPAEVGGAWAFLREEND